MKRLRIGCQLKQMGVMAGICLLLSGCSYDCIPSDGLRIHFTGYSPSELKQFTIRKFEKGTGFTRLVDSIIVDSTQARYNLVNDTARLIALSSTINLVSTFDYEVVVTATGKRYQIANLKEPLQKGQRGWAKNKEMCMNQINSGTVNGTNTFFRFDILYLSK